jgi:hypothetical protein
MNKFKQVIKLHKIRMHELWILQDKDWPTL